MVGGGGDRGRSFVSLFPQGKGDKGPSPVSSVSLSLLFPATLPLTIRRLRATN